MLKLDPPSFSPHLLGYETFYEMFEHADSNGSGDIMFMDLARMFKEMGSRKLSRCIGFKADPIESFGGLILSAFGPYFDIENPNICKHSMQLCVCSECLCLASSLIFFF
jgi:hypothetical protein